MYIFLKLVVNMLIDVHAFSLFVFGWFTSVKVICP